MADEMLIMNKLTINKGAGGKKCGSQTIRQPLCGIKLK